MNKTQKMRRRKNKTDYGKRFKLLKSGMPRLVFRKTNKQIIVQYVESKESQDKVIFNLNSKELLKYGWDEKAKGSLKSVPASYLTGLMVGNRIKEKKLKKPIVDFGMIRMIRKSGPYAFLKGLIDSGIEIECKDEFFPKEDRIKGEKTKIKIAFDEIKAKMSK